MKTLYLDCRMGAAGDMLTAALWELLPDKEAFLAQMNALGLPGVRVEAQSTARCGITGTHFSVTVNGEEESFPDHHEHSEHKHGEHEYGEHEHGEHEHGEHEHHHHSGMADLTALTAALPVSESVRGHVQAVYRLLAEAESAVHGVPVEQIHFHEVGTLDAVADITAVCLLMEKLGPEQVIVSPVHVGSGHVHCAHGILPVPAPATARLLQGIPIYSSSVDGELCTPTGAALLRHFAGSFGPMPVMRVERIGYGMGRKEREQANCLRAFWGETEESGTEDSVLELQCNVDDMTPEAVSFAMEMLFSGGALDVWTLSAGMKKSRPGILLSVLCRPEDKEAMLKLLFSHTSTLGVRVFPCRRCTLERSQQSVVTPWGEIRQKVSRGYGIEKAKYEYEDLARLARQEQCSLDEIRRRIER